MATDLFLSGIHNKENSEDDESSAVLRISEASAKDSCCLDLKNLNLKKVPSEILNLPYLQKLYLSDNSLDLIPPELLKSLNKLRWLDLRNNNLENIPTEIKHLKELQTLLLDNNKIKILPVELGLLKKLAVLHHRNNPIEFPPEDVLEKGSKHIVKYLYDCYSSLVNIATNKGLSLFMHSTEDDELKTRNNPSHSEQQHLNGGKTVDAGISDLTKSMDVINLRVKDKSHSRKYVASVSPDRHHFVDESLRQRPNSAHLFDANRIEKKCSVSNLAESQSDVKNYREFDHEKLVKVLGNMVHADKNLPDNYECQKCLKHYPGITHKSKLYKKIESNYIKSKRNVSKSHSASLLSKLPSQTNRHMAFLPEDPPQPTLEKIRVLYKREQKRKARKESLIKRESEIQRMKDASRISDWRDDYTEYQKRKLFEYLTKTCEEIKEEADQRIFSGPFSVQKDDLAMISTDELRVLRERPIKRERPKNLDPASVLQLELASFEKDNRLTRQVHEHTKDILERFKLPIIPTHAAIRSEMLVAKKSLDAAIRLHRRVQQRLETLGYFHGSNRWDSW
ncbi:unnamed protein product [Heterobilharzia americana]|nr:unnamed protein product [Heterobilharzia americana]CAH8581585.1 unnamed protein product [Heterobilharzia americana]